MGRRLSLLLAVESATGLLLVILGIASLQELAKDSAFMQRYVLVPIQGINAALDDITSLGDHPRDTHIVDRIDAFTKHYRDEIQVAGSSRPDARRQTEELRRSGNLALIDQERLAVASLQQGVKRLSAAANGTGVSQADLDGPDGPRARLHELLRINLQFVDAAEDDLTASAARTRVVLVSVGLLGVVLSGVLAWRVRMAIAPRIEMLIRKIHRFHEFGIHERTVMRGHDDIAVLSNALDVGFAAISERSRERETFLAVAAHELKTPLTSILGFVQAAVAHPEQRERALDIIRRQARRLAHLVEDLLWAAQERSGQLAFQPIPVDFAKVARGMAREVEDSVPSHRIVLAAPQDGIPVLADQALITHALWGLLTYAGVLSVADAPLDVAIERTHAHVIMELRIHGPPLPPEDQIRIFDPFATIQYEGGTAVRSAMGLSLCRRIANLHGGSLRVDDKPGVGPVFILELPA